MANTKISALSALVGSDVAQLSDVLPIVDTSATTTKKILISELSQAMLVLGTEQASTSGTSIDFTGIPAWAKRITIMFANVSMAGISSLLVQLGDAGGIETTGYKSGVADSTPNSTDSTAGMIITVSYAAAGEYSGKVVLELEDSANFTWSSTGIIVRTDTSNVRSHVSAGTKSTSAALTQVRITTSGGTDTFDAGAINILYE